MANTLLCLKGGGPRGHRFSPDMSQAPLLLTSAADCGRQEAVLVWDPIAGNQVASFSGVAAAPGTLTAANDVIVSAVSRKPILQFWSLQSTSSFKRLTTKGVVNALTFSYDGFFMYLAIEKSIYVYQVGSGCLLAVLEASHMAPVGALVVSQRYPGLPSPLLLSADTSGLVACWPALVSIIDTFAIGSRDSTTTANEVESDTKHKPLWYVVQASRGLPAFSFIADGLMIACAGTDGVKLFDSKSGRLLLSVLEQSRPLRCICALPQDDRFIFAGTDNGILHSLWLRDPQNPSTCEVSFRRCFVDVELSSIEKAICYVCASPVDSGLHLLAMPVSNSGSPRITGLLMVTRPAWLFEGQTAVGASNKSNLSDPLEVLRPMKRHLGWQVEDLLYLRLPNLKRDRISDDYLEGIYQDEFFKTVNRHTFALPIDAVKASTACTSNDSVEVIALRREKEALEKRNGELMRILVANCLHY
ncbi:hypothetical protein TcWFU_006451 [Taenia crassiceps]|uniref:Uncharacterized protein n=1 Tax=Taenia crassiceps TaxID=6207 RepID=A0ABR4QEH7_9CEST